MSPSSVPGALAALALCGLLGCVEKGIIEMTRPYDYSALPRPPEAQPEEGAIWRGSTPSGSFLFFDQKARGVGDLVTVIIREDLEASGTAATDVSSTGSIDANISSDVGIANLITTGIGKLVELLGGNAPAPLDSASLFSSDNENIFSGSGTTSRSGSFEAVITCRVVGVLPNGVFHIRGRRSIVVNHEEQYLTLEALVRKEDISIGNTVVSAALAEAQLTLDGIGVVDDKQRPGWLARAVDWIYPF